MEAKKDWTRIESLFHAARGLDAGSRVTYLDGACAGDAELRTEVESLLAALEGREGFLAEPAFSRGLKVLSGGKAETLVGKLCGPYRILKELGRGGMGEVYLAEDTRLGRKVALKFVSGRLVDDSAAKRQLVKEAQAAAMLDHPNICAVHGLEEAEGHIFIVMQYVEGETLDAVIGSQPPPLERAVSYATQIVSAVAEAHAHGILHRDLKPQNVIVTAGGQVKVLDFGLAKIIRRPHGPVGAGESGAISQAGLVVGTVAYMSPEQLRAERLDFRSDIFSLGTLLFELFSAKRPFARASDAEAISAILSSPPLPLTHPAGEIPPALARIILKCLEKDKEQRYSSASELLYELNLRHGESGLKPPRWRPGPRAAAALLLLALLIVAAVFTYLRLTRVPQLAVLPIVNTGADTELEPLGDGLTADLINKLSRLPSVRVKALTAVSGYKQPKESPQEIGRRLGVDAVLTATVARRGEALQLQASLIDTTDGSQLWGGKYGLQADQILDIQEELSRRVAVALKLPIGEGEQKILAHRPTYSPEAAREYYHGLNLWEKRSKENIRQIIAHFERAIEIDPTYAEAYAGLANCYAVINTVAYLNMPTDEAMRKAQYRARQALDRDASLPEAHTALGVVKFKYEWQWAEAEAEFRQAIALKPDYAWAHYWYSQLLAVNGRWDEAVARSRAAYDHAPFSPVARMNSCRTLYYARRHDEAEACFRRLLADDPSHKSSQYVLTYVHMQQGRYAEAITTLEKLYEKDKVLAAAPLGFAYGKVGRRGDAMRVLEELRAASALEAAKGGQVPIHEEAIIYIGLGEKNEVYTRLEGSYQERFVSLIYLNADPIYDSLRSDARFIDLARRLNLMPPA